MEFLTINRKPQLNHSPPEGKKAVVLYWAPTMSLSEFRNRRAIVEAHFEPHPAFNALIPVVSQMYHCVRAIAQKAFPTDMGKLLMLCNREFLVGTSLLQSGLPFDAAANTRRAIEIAKLALAIKRDRGNAEKWM